MDKELMRRYVFRLDCPGPAGEIMTGGAARSERLHTLQELSKVPD